jgi:signal transduction histidine kinase
MLFCNLIHNAIKYNKPKGALRIIGAEGEDFVSISVIDSGIGIAEDKLPLIFNEFYRVKDEATKNISGTGLGLSICEKIVKELGGSIEVISKKNVGTTFTVKLLKAN